MQRVWIVVAAFITMHSEVSAQKSPVYAPKGIALDGYDVVAFFTKGKPVKGSSQYSFQWNGASWQFADKEDLDSFKTTPEKYTPQYGGYCAYGTAEGHKAPTEADTWTIVNNRLYFNYNKKVKEIWVKDQSAFIDSANRKWPLIRDKE